MSLQTVLIVETETDVRRGIQLLLQSETTDILEAENGKQALALINEQIDLVILGMTLPDSSGLQICQEIRKLYTVPILFLADNEHEEKGMKWLYAGGDDCFLKTYPYPGIVARIKALLRRYCVYKGKMQIGVTWDNNFLVTGDIRIALGRNEVWKGGQEIFLTELEAQILRLMMQHPQKVLSTEYIYTKVWNEPYYPISNGTVMVHISKLRVKIEDNPKEPRIIKTIWGKGYRFEPPSY